MIEDALYEMLAGTAQGGNPVQDRIYEGLRSKGARLPAVVYRRIQTDREFDMEGQIGATQSVFLLVIYAATFREARTIREHIRTRLAPVGGLRGRFSGVEIDGAFIEDERHATVDDQAGDEHGRLTLTLRIAHQERRP